MTRKEILLYEDISLWNLAEYIGTLYTVLSDVSVFYAIKYVAAFHTEVDLQGAIYRVNCL